MTSDSSFFRNLFKFRFINICGIIIALVVWGMTTERQPLSNFLFHANLYTIIALVALAFHLFVWLAVYRGSFYDFGRLLRNFIQDYIILNLIVLSCLGSLFLLRFFVWT